VSSQGGVFPFGSANGNADTPKPHAGEPAQGLTHSQRHARRFLFWILLLGSSGALLWIRRTIQVLRLGVFLAGGQARVLAVERAACGRIDAERGIADRLWSLHAAPAWGRRAGLSHRALRLGKRNARNERDDGGQSGNGIFHHAPPG